MEINVFKRIYSKLQYKFLLYFTGIVILIVISISAAIYYFQKETLLKQAQEKAFSLTSTLAYTSLNAILLDDYIVLQTLIDSMSDNEDIISVVILDSTGTVIAADIPELRGHQYKDSLTQKALESNSMHLVQVPSEHGMEIWDTAVPISNLDQRIATARIKYSISDTYKGLLYTILAIGLIAIALSLFLAYHVSRNVTRPLEAAVVLAGEYGKGNFDAKIPIHTEDEIGKLVQTLNQLSTELQTLLEEQVSNEGLIMIGEFAAYIIHDLKNPLNGIHLLADGLHRKMAADSSLRRYTAEILLASQRVEDFIKRTLDIAKSTQLQIRMIQINELIEETIEAVNLVPTQIVRKYDTNMPLIPADYSMLMMALKNLLINAAQAITDHGIISIESHWNDEAIISISDTGVGIAEDRLTTIFRPFFSMKNQGHGLGLAMVKRAVNLHQGRIEVTSEVGVGSTFIIFLPAQRRDVFTETQANG
jgi:signal transduction histidine kinase